MVTVWKSDSALTVPVCALFRKGESWAAFVVRDGGARTALIQIGHRNNQAVEVISGLSPGDRVVLHPSDRVTEGVRVAGAGEPVRCPDVLSTLLCRRGARAGAGLTGRKPHGIAAGEFGQLFDKLLKVFAFSA